MLVQANLLRDFTEDLGTEFCVTFYVSILEDKCGCGKISFSYKNAKDEESTSIKKTLFSSGSGSYIGSSSGGLEVKFGRIFFPQQTNENVINRQKKI